MKDIIEKPAKAGDLPLHLRGNMEANVPVMVSVRRLTVNNFTEEFEAHVLEAAQSGTGTAMEIKDALAMLREIANEDNVH